ncbi:deaminase [Paraoerskovia sediminicola]|uniref:Deaminase n=1 Tax=Paraoerskovia sediminicola TaxID=1138587 RepID=A0ABN6XC60_9CELL|nr:dihydrofolate reductase family protein [Paraoerskovia sediminicola]BDZ42434.1 deaminase [Paraoerskovia sediminicola]
MARLVYSAIASLDGFIADSDGDFTFAEPDAEVHAYINDLSRGIGTFHHGRRTWDVMKVWQDLPTGPDEPPEMNDFAEIWRSADKVVHSTTIEPPSTPRTTLERGFDAAAVRAATDAAVRDVAIDGPTLAAHAFTAGIVDDVHLFLHPVLVGSGLRALPDGVRLDLELVHECRFACGVVHLHHRVRR